MKINILKPTVGLVPLLSTTFLCMMPVSTAHAQAAPASSDDQAVGTAPSLLDVPLEDLLSLESTSVAKKRQRVSDSAAAVYVITADDIRRSSADTIPDLLRGVPGVEVARQDVGGYAVSIRGFNSRLANSLLVMVDGRPQYVSTLSGVFWDQLNIPLSDIERIEVVRGPGSALWGANSSNGVINIITKHSADSGGTQIDGRAGTQVQQVSLTHGGRITDSLTYRAYGEFRHDHGLVDASGDHTNREWKGGSAGARIDWEPDDHNAYTLQGDYGHGSYVTPLLLPNPNLLTPGYVTSAPDNSYKTYSLLARWTQRKSDTFDWSLQAQYNKIDRIELGGAHLVWQLADVDLGAHWKASDTHDINFGINGRMLHDTTEGTSNFYFHQPSATDRWISGYIQDDITLVPDKVRLTVGTKLEYNNFTGFEIQPNVRLLIKPTKNLSLWGAVSRAVRTPSRFERSASLSFGVDLPGSATNPYPVPLYTTLNGVPNHGSEDLVAFEAGARANLGGNWSLDIAGYYNRYSKLTISTPTSIDPLFVTGIPFPVGVRVNVALAGVGSAQTWGTEVSLAGNIRPWWKTNLTYSHFVEHTAIDPATGAAGIILSPLTGSPRDQLSLKNSFDVGDSWSLDTQFRYVSSLYGGQVPSYTTLDARLTYRLRNGAEVSIVGSNLLEARHLEFIEPSYPAPASHVARTVSAQLRYRF